MAALRNVGATKGDADLRRINQGCAVSKGYFKTSLTAADIEVV